MFTEQLKKIHEAIGLLNSMVSGGEQHSKTSQKVVEDARNALHLIATSRDVAFLQPKSNSLMVMRYNPDIWDNETIEMHIKTLNEWFDTIGVDNVLVFMSPIGNEVSMHDRETQEEHF